MCNELNNFDCEPLYSITDVNSAWYFFKSVLTKTFNKHAPFINKRVKGMFCPWLSNDIKTLMNERDKVLRKARKTKKELDWSNYKS